MQNVPHRINHYPDESGEDYLDKTDDAYYNCDVPTVNIYHVTVLPSNIHNRFSGFDSSNPPEIDKE